MKRKTARIGHLIWLNVHQIDTAAEVILFGSRARGDEKPDSDWDILVLTAEPVSVQQERTFRDALYDLELETGEPISLFVYHKEDWLTKQRVTPFFQNVTREGVRL